MSTVDNNISVGLLRDKFIDIRYAGHANDYSETDLFDMLGVTDGLSFEKKNALLIKFIKKELGDPKSEDMLLMAFRLLKGYDGEDIKQIGQRRERYIAETGFWTDTERNAYEKCEQEKERKKVLETITNRLQKQEDRRILKLAKKIAKKSNLSAYIEQIGDEYYDPVSECAILPIPNYLAHINRVDLQPSPTDCKNTTALMNEGFDSVDENISEDAKNLIEQSAAPDILANSINEELPVLLLKSDKLGRCETWYAKCRNWIIQNKLLPVFIITICTFFFVLGIYGLTQKNTQSTGDITATDSNSPKNGLPFNGELNFVQASEYGIGGIESCVWLDELKIERGKQYVIRVFVCNDADGEMGSIAEDVAIRLNMAISAEVFSTRMSIEGQLLSGDISDSVENSVWFYGDEPFKLEFIRETGKYLCSGMTSLDERGIHVSDDVFLQNSGTFLGYNELDGQIPSGTEYAGYYTVLVRANFETKASSDWGPSRETFTVLNPPSFIALNSISDNPDYGDERHFIRVKDVSEGNKECADSVVLYPGHEYEFSVYYNNNMSSPFAMDEIGFAEGVRLGLFIPRLVEENSEGLATAYISGENAEHQEVWSSIVLVNDTSGGILLRYVPDSAIIHSSGKVNKSLLDEDALFAREGVMLGYDELNGIIPSGGLNDEASGGYVTFRLVADYPDFEVRTYLRNTEEDQWSESIEARAGDTFWCLIEYKNTGTIQQDNVVLIDYLPAGIQYVEKSSHLRNTFYPNQVLVEDGVAGNSGVNVGSYTSNASMLFWFQMQIANDAVAQNGTRKLINVVHVKTTNGSKSSQTQIKIIQ